MAKTFGKFSDLIDFSRASGGTALRRVGYGSELVTNGTDFSGGWTTTGWTFPFEQASVIGNGTNQNLYGTPVNNSVSGKLYQLSYDVISSSISGGAFRAGAFSGSSFFGSSYFTLKTTVGTHVLNFVGTPTGSGSVLDFWLTSGAISGVLVIDNISVKEVLFDQPNAPLTLFNHPTNVPRIEYDADGNRLGLLIEEARTNLITYSDDFTQWTAGSGAIVSAGAFTAPDGSLSGTEVISGGVGSKVFKNVSLSATTYAFSVWVRNTDIGVQIRIEGSGGLTRIIVDNGVISSETAIDSSGTTAYPNGLVRAYGVFTVTTAETKTISIQQNAGSMGIYGFQLEAGSFPTSYIPTSGATATRAADVASIPVSEFGYNQSEGSVVVDLRYNGVGTSPRILCFSDGTNTNRIVLDRTPLVTVVNNNSVTISNTTTSASSVLTPYKVGLSLSDSNTSITIDGETPSTFSGTIPKVISKLIIGDGQTSPRYINGHIKSINYYPRRLTDVQLMALTGAPNLIYTEALDYLTTESGETLIY